MTDVLALPPSLPPLPLGKKEGRKGKEARRKRKGSEKKKGREREEKGEGSSGRGREREEGRKGEKERGGIEEKKREDVPIDDCRRFLMVVTKEVTALSRKKKSGSDRGRGGT